MSVGHISEVLRHVTVYTVDNALCADIYGSVPNEPVDITNEMICAGVLGVGGKDACQADSGGPMYYDNVTIGIVAFGASCGSPVYPGVSMAVASYTDWIVANTI